MSWSGQRWGPEQPRLVADLTGDGSADIAGFGLDGVWVSLNNGNGTFQPPNMALSRFSYHTGWRVEKHVRLLADLTGDGRADIIGFGDAGVWTALNNGEGTFQPTYFAVNDLGYDHGWRTDQHPRYVADITGDGKADLVGFGDAGVWAALGKGDGTFQEPKFVVANFGYSQGWRLDQNPRFVADLTGDGKADLVGFNNDGVWVALGNGDGTFQSPERVLSDFDPALGWQGTKHLRIMADLNGDHRADIVGFGDAGVYSALSNGDGTFAGATFILAAMGYNDGWRLENNPRFAADITGDGKADLIGFSDTGVWTSVSGGDGAHPVLDGFSYNQGWRVVEHPRYLADLNGDGRADIIGFGDAGVWTALSNGDGTFQNAGFVLADFGYHAGPVVQSITIDFRTYNDDLNDDTLLHVFVSNRSNDSSDSAGASSYFANSQDYQDHDADWFGKNPYLGRAVNASQGKTFGNDSTHRVNLELRSKPIPVEELQLPAVNIHILAQSSDTWKFDYTLTITLDDGTVLPPYSSNINGLTGIVLNQDQRDYYGICSEVRPVPPRPVPVTDSRLTRVAIEFHTHDDNKNSDTSLGIHIVNRKSAAESQDIWVANNVFPGQEFPDSGDTYKLVDIVLPSSDVFLRDMVLPVVFINIAAGTDQWIFDYRVTLFFGDGSSAEQPYSWTTYGVVLDQDHHKHMGVYNGRPFPTLYYPHPPLTQASTTRTKSISLDFVGQKLQELLNSRQVLSSPDPLFRLTFDSPPVLGDEIPPSYVDLQFIKNDPPAPDGQPLAPDVTDGITYSRSISELGKFTTVFGVGVHLNEISSEFLAVTVNAGDNQTPLTLDLHFETGGPTEVTGSVSRDITKFEVRIRFTLRYHQQSGAVDVLGWIDDLNNLTSTQLSKQPVSYKVTGTFLGQQLNETIFTDPSRYREDLMGQVLHVTFETTDSTLSGYIQEQLRDYIFNRFSEADPITKLTPRDSINATASAWLMGGVIAAGNPERQPYLTPSTLSAVNVSNDVLTLTYTTPEKAFVYQAPPDWPTALEPGNLAGIDHIVVLTMENRSFDHMLGYLSLPYEKGGMNRADVDGLKGGEFNMYNRRKIQSFRLAAGDTIFSPGPGIDPEHVAAQVNGGKMDGFVQAQADGFGPATAHRVMGYHTADNVPVYDSLARDFAVGHRWFAPHPGSTFPNRFYELSGRPNIDPWGAWEYRNTSPVRPTLMETIFDHLSERKVSWTYFEHYYCMLRFFERYTFDSENIVSYDDPVKGFLTAARAGTLPSVSFIDPHFLDYPPGSFCNEPPSDIRNSQPFLQALVEALVASPKWEKTLLILTYDEHGGFYDHVPPVPAAKVSPEMLPTTGVRVPCFVASPWVKGSTVFGSDAQHFDHTSILKTITRRFMSNNPPFMGARFAAAYDLSEILDAQLRPEQFRPFIPYTLVDAASQMSLAVQSASTAIGAPLVQVTPSGTDPAQEFRFEDAGDGFVYIRTLAGLYVTADAALSIKQDRKYEQNPDRQRWKLAASAILAHPADHTISCAAVPGKVLQPLGGSTASGAAVVLADPTQHSRLTIANPWTVKSPLLPADPVNTL